MARTYSLIKKDSQEHKAALTSRFIKNRDVVAVGEAHVMIPQRPSVGFGHRVSHAKNRTNRLFRPNLQSLTVEIDGVKKSIRISNRDLRSYKKITAPEVRE